MREIYRKIVSAVIISKDGKILLGKKDPEGGGVYSDCWHIPGGKLEDNETLIEALAREVQEEVGIDIMPYQILPIPFIGQGDSEKILKETKGKVLCHMEFNRFEIRINDKDADQIEIKLSDDLVETRWFGKEELKEIKQIPGGEEFFKKMGYL